MLTLHTSPSANVHTLHTPPTPQKHLTHHLALCTCPNRLKRKLTVGAVLTHLALYSCRHTKRHAGDRLKWVRTICSLAHFNDPCFSRQNKPLNFPFSYLYSPLSYRTLTLHSVTLTSYSLTLTFHAGASVAVDPVQTDPKLAAGVAAALVDVYLAVSPRESQRTHANVVHPGELL